MKALLGIILTLVCLNSIGQAKQLNELLSKYVYRDFLWNKYQPIVLQNSQEIIVPHFINLDSLFIIKWHDIDSIEMFDTHKGHVRIIIHGNVIKYQLCHDSENCNNNYYERLYKANGSTESIFIPLILKTRDGEPILTKSIRRKFKRAFKQISNNTIKENYRTKTQASIKYKKNSIIRYIGSEIYEYKQINVRAKQIKKVQKLEIHNNKATLQDINVASFTLYITTNDVTSTFSNEGPYFNNEIKAFLKSVIPGTILTFDMVKVNTKDGVRTIDGMSIRVK